MLRGQNTDAKRIVKFSEFSEHIREGSSLNGGWGGVISRAEGSREDCWWHTRDTWNRSHDSRICPYEIK